MLNWLCILIIFQQCSEYLSKEVKIYLCACLIILIIMLLTHCWWVLGGWCCNMDVFDPGSTPFHPGFMRLWMKSCENSVCSNFDSDYPIMSQFCTCHGSLAVMTCAKLWLDFITAFMCKLCTYLKKMDHELINHLQNGSQMHRHFIDWFSFRWCMNDYIIDAYGSVTTSQWAQIGPNYSSLIMAHYGMDSGRWHRC